VFAVRQISLAPLACLRGYTFGALGLDACKRSAKSWPGQSLGLQVGLQSITPLSA
jgi:hypothetical protein